MLKNIYLYSVMFKTINQSQEPKWLQFMYHYYVGKSVNCKNWIARKKLVTWWLELDMTMYIEHTVYNTGPYVLYKLSKSFIPNHEKHTRKVLRTLGRWCKNKYKNTSKIFNGDAVSPLWNGYNISVKQHTV